MADTKKRTQGPIRKTITASIGLVASAGISLALTAGPAHADSLDSGTQSGTDTTTLTVDGASQESTTTSLASLDPVTTTGDDSGTIAGVPSATDAVASVSRDETVETPGSIDATNLEQTDVGTAAELADHIAAAELLEQSQATISAIADYSGFLETLR